MAWESQTQVCCLPVSAEVGTTCRMASPTLPNRRGQGPCSSSPLSCSSFQDFGQRGGAAFCLTRDLIFSLSTSHKPSESEGMAFLLSILLNTLLHHKLHFPLVILNLFLSLELEGWGEGEEEDQPPISKGYQDWMIYIRMGKWILTAGKSKDVQVHAED